MKTRYKISIVILCTVIFYLGLQFLGISCRTFLDGCFILHEMAYYSSMVIPVGPWGDNGIGNWTGTASGKEIPGTMDYFTANRSFIFFYIIIPALIISAIIFKDRIKRK